MAVAAVLVAALAGSVLAEARVYSGTGKANRVTGTKKSDTIRLRAGHDRARGRAGADKIFGAAGNDRLRGDGSNDRVSGGKGRDRLYGGKGRARLYGGKGRDRLHGGKGRDRLRGGAGNDTLNAVDKRKDALVSGGAGRNRCRIDAVDLSVVRGCATIITVPSGGSPPGSGPGAPTGGLALTSATGLQCASALPTCSYTLAGTGAKSQFGTISGGGGVTTVGGSLAPQDDNWDAAGLYGCSADGYLRITIGSELLDVPVDCVTSG
jgi:Ca2+-binding RTX toxin-like protein